MLPATIQHTSSLIVHFPVPHWKQREFLNHLSGYHMNIQFTVEEEEEGHLPFLDILIYRIPDGSVVLSLIGSPPIAICIYTGIHFTTLQANNQSWLPWYTEPELSVARITLLKNWNFSPLFSRKTDEALSRYDEPLNLLHWSPRPTKDPSRLHWYLTPRWHGWLSRILAKHIKSVSLSLPPRRG